MNEKLSMSQLERLDVEGFKSANKMPVILVLENIRSGLNVGSIFRSSDAFRVERIICTGYTPVPPHREVLKSALGATESVDWIYVENAIDVIKTLREEGVSCWAVEQVENSVRLQDFSYLDGQKTAFVMGNEVSGVSQEVINACHGAVEIDQHGTKHSLNVAVCAGIVLFSASNKLLR